METALAEDSRTLALQVHQLLQDLDAARFKEERSAALQARVEGIRQALATLLAALADAGPSAALRERLTALQEALASWSLPEAAVARAAWMDLKVRVQPVYEDLVDALRVEDVHVPRVRPTNYHRNLMHGTSWVVALVTIGVSGGDWRMLAVAGSIAVAGWAMEIGRWRSPAFNVVIMKAFGRVAHPHEAHRINSATWYATALTIIAAVGSVPAAAVAVTALGVGDPIAALVGRRWGRIPTLNGRSLEGSLAFAASSWVGCAAVLAVMAPTWGWTAVLAVSAAGTVAGAVAETFCRRVDDNFGIPLAAGGAAALVALALGVPL